MFVCMGGKVKGLGGVRKVEVDCEWMKDGRIEGWAFVVGKTF